MRANDLADLLERPELTHHLEATGRLMRAQIPDPFKSFLEPRLDAGKKLRPALLLAIIPKINDDALRMAAAVELVHKASLLHDALTDEELDAANRYRYLLAGDYLLAAGLRRALSVNPQLAAELAETIQLMAAGQALQLSEIYKADPRNKTYQAVITQKTASLFALSCQAGGRLAGYDSRKIESCRVYGLDFGRAFQIMDDIEDGEFNESHSKKARAQAEKYLKLAEKQAPGENLARLPGYYLAKIPSDT